jgi:hypothetical protein
MREPSRSDHDLVPECAAASAVSKRVEQLALEQGVRSVLDPQELRGDFWPEDEDLEEFLTALRNWRREGRDYD